VRRWQNYELLYDYFSELRVLEKRRRGDIQEQWQENGMVLISSDLTWQDLELVTGDVEAHLNETDEWVRSRLRWSFYDERARFDRRLRAALATLEAAGIEVLEGHPFSEAKSLAGRFWHQPQRLSTGEIAHFIEKLLRYALPLARRLMEHNFPTMVQEFGTTTQAPFTAVAAINRDVEPGFSYATIYICEPDAGQEEIEIIARGREEVRTEIIRNPSGRLMVWCEGVWRQRRDTQELAGQRHFDLRSLFHPSHDYLGDRTHFGQVGEVEPVIRAVVYDWIREEIVAAFRGLCRKYGVRVRESDWTLFGQSKN
jgi:hypothetical protein